MAWNRRSVLELGAAMAIPLPAWASDKTPKVGEMAPDADLTLVDGTKLKLSETRGDVVVLNIWATWCSPCRTELPLLDSYYRVQKAYGLRVYALTTEDSVPLYQLKKLFATMAIAPTRKIKGAYGPIDGAVPSNFIIDRSGRLRYAAAGAFTLDLLNQELIPLLREPRPA